MTLNNVLYVDDNKDYRNRAIVDFKKKGLASRVDVVNSRESGVKKIRKTPYDLIVVDGLEGNCFGLIEDVKDLQHGPIVLFTSNPTIILQAQSLNVPVYTKTDGLDKIIKKYKR